MDNIIDLSTFIDSECVLIDDQYAVHKSRYVIADGSHVFYSFVCLPGVRLKELDIVFIVERNASVRLEFLVAHVDASVKIVCVMNGESSQAFINGASIAQENNRIEINTEQLHKAAHAKTSLVVRTVGDNRATISYSGMIHIEQSAHGSLASQENKNILLADTARVVSIPSLQVLAHDVHCFHGSATSRFDSQHLFYAASRGISPDQIKRLLINAFFARMFKNYMLNNLLQGFL